MIGAVVRVGSRMIALMIRCFSTSPLNLRLTELEFCLVATLRSLPLLMPPCVQCFGIQNLAWRAGFPSGTHIFHILCVFARIVQYRKKIKAETYCAMTQRVSTCPTDP